MRSFMRFCLAALFVFILPVALLAAVPRLNGFSLDKVKQNLSKSQVYDKAGLAIQDLLPHSEEEPQQSDAASQMAGVVRQEVTPHYVQAKVEALLDQTSAWVIDPTEPAPAISLNDLKQKLVEHNPEAQRQLDELLTGLKSAEDTMPMDQMGSSRKSDQSLRDILTSTGNLQTVASGDLTFSLEQPLAGLPSFYRYYIIGLPVAIALLLLLLLGILGLCHSWPARLKAVGWTLIISAIWNALLSAAFATIVVSGMWLRSLPLSGNVGEMVTALLQSVQGSLLANYSTIELIATILLMLIGITLIVISRFVAHKTMPTAPSPAPSNTPSKNTERPSTARPANTQADASLSPKQE